MGRRNNAGDQTQSGGKSEYSKDGINIGRRSLLKATSAGVLSIGTVQPYKGANDDNGAFVYFGSRDGKLCAVNASTGELEWEFTDPTDAISSSPTVVGGIVYVGAGTNTDPWRSDETLYAVDAATGELVWEFTEPSSGIYSSPTVIDETVYVGTQGTTLYAVDAETGELEWEFTEPRSQIQSSPTVDNEVVYVGTIGSTWSSAALYAVDSETGELEWEFTEPSGMRSSPTLSDGTVYVGSSGGSLYAVDTETGEKEWEFTFASDGIRSSPAVVDGVVYIGSDNATLYAVDATTGDLEWEFTDLSNAIREPPTVAGGTVYFGSVRIPGQVSQDETLYAVDAETGELEWEFTEPTDGITTSPTVFNDTLYVGSVDNSLYAVDATTGELEWEFTGAGDSIHSSPTVVDDPVEGHSVDSRVRLGTLGHHHNRADEIEIDPDDDEPDDEQSLFDVTITEATDPVSSGSSLEVEAEIGLAEAAEEEATAADIPQACLFVGGEEVACEDVVLDEDWTTTVGFVHEIPEDEERETISIRVEFLGAEDETEVEVSINEGDSRVAPDTELLFETGIPSGVDAYDVVWYVDDEEQSGVFMMGYQNHAGNAAFSTTFEESGTYEVRAEASDGSELESWSVSIEDGGRSAPSINEMNSDPGEDETVHADESIQITVSTTDPEGNLDRVLWQGGQNQVAIWEESSISGEEDTATLEVTGPEGDQFAHWLDAGYPTLAAVITEDGRVSDIDGDDGPAIRPPFEVEIVETTEPETPDENLEVTANVVNEAAMVSTPSEDQQEIELLVDGETVDSESVELDWAESTTVTLSSDVEVDDGEEFGLTVQSPVDEDSTDATVDEDTDEDAELEVTITDTSSPVDAGDVLEVTAELHNPGDTEVTQDVQLVVGEHNPTIDDTATVTLAPSESQTITLSFESAVVENDQEFPVVVESEDDSDEEMVLVYGTGAGEPGEIHVEIVDTDSPVDAGEVLAVTAELHNPGNDEVSQDVQLVVGNDPTVVDTVTATLGPDESETVSLSFESAVVDNDQEFPVVVESEDDTDEEMVLVYGTDS